MYLFEKQQCYTIVFATSPAPEPQSHEPRNAEFKRRGHRWNHMNRAALNSHETASPCMWLQLPCTNSSIALRPQRPNNPFQMEPSPSLPQQTSVNETQLQHLFSEKVSQNDVCTCDRLRASNLVSTEITSCRIAGSIWKLHASRKALRKKQQAKCDLIWFHLTSTSARWGGCLSKHRRTLRPHDRLVKALTKTLCGIMLWRRACA